MRPMADRLSPTSALRGLSLSVVAVRESATQFNVGEAISCFDHMTKAQKTHFHNLVSLRARLFRLANHMDSEVRALEKLLK